MRILEYVVTNSNRFPLTMEQTIIYKPIKPLQIILGQNGSGKSSLIEMLSPLSPDPKNFNDKGSSYFKCKYKGSEYIVTFTNYPKKHYSFIIDGEEKNIGGTKRVNDILCLEHFNLDSKTYQVLIGNKSISNMSPNDRKEWFKTMNNIDYSYSFSLFNNLKTRLRDLQGGRKILVNKMNVLLESSSNDVTSEEIDKEIKKTNDLKSELTKQIFSVDPIKQIELNNKLIAVNDKIEKTLNVITEEDHTINFKSIIEDLNNKLYHCKQTSDNQLIELEKLNNTVADNSSLESAEEELKKLETIFNSLEKSEIVELGELPIETLLNYQKTLPKIISILTNLNVSGLTSDHISTYKASKQKFDNKLEKISKIKTDILTLDKQIELINEDLKVTIECDSCGNIVNKKKNEISKERLVSEIENYYIVLDNLNKNLSDELEILDLSNSFIEAMANVDKLFKYNELNIIQDLIEHNFNFMDPSNIYNIMNYMNQIQLDATKVIETDKLLITINNKEREVSQLRSLNRLDVTGVETKIKLLSIEYTSNTKLMSEYSKEIQGFKLREKQYDELLDNVEQMISLQDAVRDDRERYLKHRHNILITEQIDKHEFKINELYKDRNKRLYTMTQIEDLEKEISELDDRVITLKDLIDELSPVTGLIGESISGFLGHFIKEVNSFIGSIWNYSLEVKLSDFDDKGLNYKFPVSSNGKKPVEDLSKTSSSMKEIIDLAFKLVSIKYKGLEHMPLYLDEFGNTFDEGHQDKIYEILDKVSRLGFKQIFMISHFKHMYGGFTNSNFNVLSKPNVNLNNITCYNECLAFK